MPIRTRWPLGLALLCFLVGSLFGANAGQDFERWVVTGLWLAVGLVWLALWRMDVRRRRRNQARLETRVETPADPPASTVE